MSRMRKESNRQKKKARERTTYLVQQRAGVPSSDLRVGVDENEIIERMSSLQRFKIDSESAKRFMEDKEREIEELKRKMSLTFD